MEKNKKQKRRMRPLNLNLILWFSFLVFAVLLIVLFTTVQNFQFNRHYREHIEENLRGAERDLETALQGGEKNVGDISKVMLSVANRYSVRVYFFLPNGEFVYPDSDELPFEQKQRIIHEVDEMIRPLDARSRKWSWAPILDKGEATGYATLIVNGGREHYLYVSSSFETVQQFSSEMGWVSLITALFAVALSFVVSGFVSMAITKSVSEVTERAKELARGNFEAARGGGYFCTEVNELSEALDYAGAEISKTDRMQKELIANVSHDFKTPLTMIKAYASMIREISGDDPEKRAKHTQIIIDEADRLAALVGDVLDLSRIQAGIKEGEHTVFNLSEDVYRVAGRFGYLTETQGYCLETDVEDDLYTFAERSRVEQVLYNLIGNAFNYTGEDKKVVIRLKKGENGARFEVLDSGKGIPKEELDTIWERYYRSTEMHKRPVQGTGLGLSIVKSVLQKNNIPFGVQSETGKGSCFWVDFPDPPDTHTEN